MKVSLRKVKAIVFKQLQVSIKNLNILSLILFTPLFCLLMVLFLPFKVESPKIFVLALGSIMNIMMAGSMMVCYVMAEDKEKNTLRLLMTSTVTPMEYLLGTGFASFIATMLISLLLIVITGAKVGILGYIAITAFTGIIGIVVGAVIGILSKDQLSASMIGVPFLMLFLLLPILASFNKGVMAISNFVFSQQLYSNVTMSPDNSITLTSAIILTLNLVVAIGLFVFIYQKRKLDK